MALEDQHSVLKYGHLGLSFAIFLGGSFFLGMKADERFGTGSTLSLLGGAVGLGAGLYYLIREVEGLRGGGRRAEPGKGEDDSSTDGKR